MTHVRPATPTVAFIDQYCAQYRALLANVRHFEQFTALHLGLLAETRRDFAVCAPPSKCSITTAPRLPCTNVWDGAVLRVSRLHRR